MAQNVQSEQLNIPYLQKSIAACVTVADEVDPPKYGIILTHGAGGDMNLPQLEKLAHFLAGKGFLVMRFTCKGLNLVYRVKVFTEILKFMKDNYKGLIGCFIGGRSMGSRAAVGVVNSTKGEPVSDFVNGVICISYPLHTKDKTSDLRDSPLYELTVPLCFISGTSDEMCDKQSFTCVLTRMAQAEIMWVESADHGLKVNGCPENEVVNDTGNFIAQWCQRIISASDETTESSPVTKIKDAEQKERPKSSGRKRKAVSS